MLMDILGFLIGITLPFCFIAIILIIIMMEEKL